MNKLRADMGGMGEDEPAPYEVGQTVTVISAPDTALVGQTGTVQSSACGVYYALDIGGVVSYHPDGNLGGDRPVAQTDVVPPEAPPAPEVPPVDPAMARTAAKLGGSAAAGQIEIARTLAKLGGSTAAGQIEIASLATLGHNILARTKATTTDAAMMAIEAAMVASEQLPALRAKLAKLTADDALRAKAEDLRIRGEKLTSALRAGAFTSRTQAFDVSTKKVTRDGKEVDVEVLTPKAVWLRGTVTDLDDQLAALSAGAQAPRGRVDPDVEASVAGEPIPAAVATYAHRRGITDPKTIAALAREHAKNNGGAAAQESTR